MEFDSQVPPELSQPAPEAAVPPVPPPNSDRAENPPWSGWDLIYIVLVTLGMIVLSLWVVAYIARRVAYPHLPLFTVMNFPMVAFSSQMLAYVVVLGFMFTTATAHTEKGFRAAVSWNWPQRWPIYLLVGIGFCVGLQILARFLPMPKKIPMETFFETPLRAWAIALFGMSFIPLMEELFFRGFLYPVLARRVGMVVAVVLTSLSFTAIHVPQLADPHMPLATSWGAVLIILIIGSALTIIRAVTRSVAAGVLVHMGYNGFTSLLAIIATGGFRHLDRLTQ
jgi:membrane protease YdiL (CAAX protease family)